jgi:hypothetical protein
MPGSSLPNPTESGQVQRLWGFDLLRYCCFFSVVCFHTSYVLWAPFGLTQAPSQSLWIWPLESLARLFAFGGFAILFISFWLMGYRKSLRERAPIYVLIFLVFFGLWLVILPRSEFSWDIYPFLLVAVSLIYVFDRLRIPPLAQLAFGAVLLSWPWVKPTGSLETFTWTEAFFGICTEQRRSSDWPLLPWLGLPLFSHALGESVRQIRMEKWRRGESIFWLSGLIVAIPNLNKYYVTPLGSAFSCHAFQLPIINFWSHLFVVILLLRLSLLVPAPPSWLGWVGQSPISQRFFIVYGAHYVWLWTLAQLIERTPSAKTTQSPTPLLSPPLFFTLVVGTWLLIESFRVVKIPRLAHHKTWLKINER